MSSKLDQFEELLRRDQNYQSEIKTRQEIQQQKASKEPITHKAEKSASLDDFIQMIDKIVRLALKDMEVEFIPDEGTRIIEDPNYKIEHPYITYHVVSREPKIERKPRERESLIPERTDRETDRRYGRIYGQKFKCIIQFNIFASEYKTANAVMNTFEELIYAYTHYFKKNGVAEVLFEKHLTDKNFDVFRQRMSVRNLQYYVEVEKLYTAFDSEIKEIQIK